jgi:metal-sulfur cluster biosynthetic enzyme
MISDAQVWDALREVRDPEVGISIVDLGLVYEVTVDAGSVYVALTMTTPACPLSGYIAEVAEDAIRRRDRRPRSRWRSCGSRRGPPIFSPTRRNVV